MKLAFIGTGYVGLVSGTGLAEMGHAVVCADIDRKKIAKLQKGEIPIYELGLEELVHKNVSEGRLSFTLSVAKAIRESDVVFNAVGTPPNPRTGQADLQYVRVAAETFGENLNGYKIFVNKSTVPVGTGILVRKIIEKASGGKQDFAVVSNPEFLREGAAVRDFLNPDRVVMGVEDERARKVMEKVYRPLARAGRPIMFTSVKSAEIIKYASNSFLATKISFINEIANFCELSGGNVREVARGMGYDERIGSRFLSAGIGYGGSCFPKDVKALIHTGAEHRYDFKILRAVEEVNAAQKMKPFKILKAALKNLKGKTVAVWGVAFKPRTDDIREAPALFLIEALLEAGARVRAFDPVAMEHARVKIQDKNIYWAESSMDAVAGSDALAIETEWDEFRTADYATLQAALRGNIIVDGRNILERQEAEEAGLRYYGIGV